MFEFDVIEKVCTSKIKFCVLEPEIRQKCKYIIWKMELFSEYCLPRHCTFLHLITFIGNPFIRIGFVFYFLILRGWLFYFLCCKCNVKEQFLILATTHMWLWEFESGYILFNIWKDWRPSLFWYCWAPTGLRSNLLT